MIERSTRSVMCRLDIGRCGYVVVVMSHGRIRLKNDKLSVGGDGKVDAAKIEAYFSHEVEYCRVVGCTQIVR